MMPPRENRSVDYERKDVAEARILAIAAGLVAGIIAVYLVSAAVLRFMRGGPAPSSGSVMEEMIRQMPPQPRLQSNPPEDLNALRREEDRQLNEYGWVDRERGIVRIPIRQAMEAVIKEGLPARRTK
jgi:hypothetical protein